MTNRQCSARVYSATEYQKQQCLRKGVILEDGKYWCKQHIPSIKVARDTKLLAKWSAKNNARLEASCYERRAKEFHDALDAIANCSCDTRMETTMVIIARAALAKAEEG